MVASQAALKAQVDGMAAPAAAVKTLVDQIDARDKALKTQVDALAAKPVFLHVESTVNCANNDFFVINCQHLFVPVTFDGNEHVRFQVSNASCV